MVKKSKKSKSKRIPLRKKYKVIRKVKEHHRKKAKEARRLGLKHKRKGDKDPGIPNEWPFKEQELKALEARRARAIVELEQKKALRKERAQKRKLGILDDDMEKLPNLVSSDKENFGEACSHEVSKDITKNSDRAFYKELVKVIEASDVILEVIDARDPIGTRCIDMEKMVLKSGPDKHLVLLLNKIDLVPREAVEKWLKYLREELPAVAFKCSTQQQRMNLGWKSSNLTKPRSTSCHTSDCLGADTLLKLLKNYSRSHEIKKSITVGVIGLPNVGKSSLINSLKRTHVANVGSTPGLTRAMQEIRLDKNVTLLDSPGVTMLKSGNDPASVALRNCKRIEKLEDPVAPVKEILKLCESRLLVTLYKVPDFQSVDDFLSKVATVRGKLKKGGVADSVAAARIVLHDWNGGKIPYFTLPPARRQEEEARIVSEFREGVNIDDVYSCETSFIRSLKSVNDYNPVEVPNLDHPSIEETMMEEQEGDAKPVGKEVNEDDMVDSTVKLMGEDDTANLVAAAARSEMRRQNEKLYDAEGILNTKKMRAEKKKRKNLARTDKMDEDYDFKVDYFNRNQKPDDDHITAEVPMSCLDFSEE